MSAPTSLSEQLVRDEKTVLHAYPDHLGFLTIGTGRLIDKRKGGGISEAENAMLLANDIATVQQGLAMAIPWYQALDPVRRACIENMAFQMGVAGLLKFQATLGNVKRGDYGWAAKQMMRSLWATQTPERAHRVSEQMRTGQWQ